jgi:hypothetical protein
VGAKAILERGRLQGPCAKEGDFAIDDVPATSYVIEAVMPGYLTARRSVKVEANKTTPVPPVLLLGGDANNDGRVGIADLAWIGAYFNTKPPGSSQADINDDTIVDIYDLVLAGANFGRSQSPWPG